jgi:hypothetical protein
MYPFRTSVWSRVALNLEYDRTILKLCGDLLCTDNLDQPRTIVKVL